MEIYGTTFWDRFWGVTGPVLLVLVIINLLLSIFWLAKGHWMFGIVSSLITFCISWIYIWSIGFFMMGVAGIQFIMSLIVCFKKRAKRNG